MAVVALLTIVIIVFNTNMVNSQSQSLNCYRDVSRYCGPCTNAGNTQCNLNCAQWEDACVESVIECQAGIPCILSCTSRYACMQARIYADLVPSIIMNCASPTACEGAQVYGGTNTDITINCNGKENSCKDLVLNPSFNSPNARNIVINCNGFGSCTGMSVNAQNANDVTINCNHYHPYVCERVKLNCGNGDCRINCAGGTGSKCNNIQVTTQSTTRSFYCIGSNMECWAAPPDFGPSPGSGAGLGAGQGQGAPSNPNPPAPANPSPPTNPNPNPPAPANPSPPSNPSPPVQSPPVQSPPVTAPAPTISFLCRYSVCDVDEWCCYGLWDNVCDYYASILC